MLPGCLHGVIWQSPQRLEWIQSRWNVLNCTPNNTQSCPTRVEPAATPLWEHQISQCSAIWRQPSSEMWCHVVCYMHSDNDKEAPGSINIIIIVGDDNDRGRFLWKLGHIYTATLLPIPRDGLPSLLPVQISQVSWILEYKMHLQYTVLCTLGKS